MLSRFLNMLGVGGFGRGGLFGRRRATSGFKMPYGAGAGLAIPVAAWFAYKNRDRIKSRFGRGAGPSASANTVGY